MPAGPGASRKAQAAQTEVALKEAARRVFARSGYHGAKITYITTEACCSAGSFYKHFAGKDDVLRALLADWLAQAGAELAADPAGDDLSQEPALRARVAAYWHTYRAHLPEIRALGEAAQVDPAFADSGSRRDAARRARHHAAALGAIARRRPHPARRPRQAPASAFNALLEGFCQVWIAGGGEPIGLLLGDQEAIDTLTRLLVHGLAGQR